MRQLLLSMRKNSERAEGTGTGEGLFFKTRRPGRSGQRLEHGLFLLLSHSVLGPLSACLKAVEADVVSLSKAQSSESPPPFFSSRGFPSKEEHSEDDGVFSLFLPLRRQSPFNSLKEQDSEQNASLQVCPDVPLPRTAAPAAQERSTGSNAPPGQAAVLRTRSELTANSCLCALARSCHLHGV